MRFIIPLSLALVLGAGQAVAAPHHHHEAQAVSAKAAAMPSTKAYIEGMEAMHRQMDIIYTGDPDIDFAAAMIPHHQGALEMAKVELAYGRDPKMRALAQRILVWQDAEIGFMSEWLRGRTSAYRNPQADTLPAAVAQKAAMEEMHKAMMIAYTGNADIDFARGMIPHHQGAVEMAWIEKHHGVDPDLRKLCDDIIRSQQQEIELMQAWLAQQTAK